MSIIPIPVTSANTTANKNFYPQRTDRKINEQNNIRHLYCNNNLKTISSQTKIRIVQPQPMCAKFEYRNLSRYYCTNSATPPYISTNGTVNTLLLIDKTKNNKYLKIFKTLFFKIYNPTFNKVHIPDKTLFSKYLPPQT